MAFGLQSTHGIFEFQKYYEISLDFRDVELSIQPRLDSQGTSAVVALETWLKQHDHSLVILRLTPTNDETLFLSILQVLVKSSADILFICEDEHLSHFPIHINVHWVIPGTTNVLYDRTLISEICHARAHFIKHPKPIVENTVQIHAEKKEWIYCG